MELPVMPPVRPMLAKPISLEQMGQLKYHGFEPKFDGFR